MKDVMIKKITLQLAIGLVVLGQNLNAEVEALQLRQKTSSVVAKQQNNTMLSGVNNALRQQTAFELSLAGALTAGIATAEICQRILTYSKIVSTETGDIVGENVFACTVLPTLLTGFNGSNHYLKKAQDSVLFSSPVVQTATYGAASVGLFVLDGIALNFLTNLSLEDNDNKPADISALIKLGAAVTIVNGALGAVGLYGNCK